MRTFVSFEVNYVFYFHQMPLDEDEKVTLRRLIKAQKAKGDKPLLKSDE